MSITYPDGTSLYTGAVFGDFEMNGYDDSDFYAIVWDDTAHRMTRTTYDSTRYASSGAQVTVDVTDENASKAREWFLPLLVRELTESAEHDVHRVEVGAHFRSTTTRGKNVGIEGTVKWYGPDKYQRGLHRVGVQVDGEAKLRFMPEHSVERLDIAEIDTQAIAARAGGALRDARGICNTYRSFTSLRSYALV